VTKAARIEVSLIPKNESALVGTNRLAKIKRDTLHSVKLGVCPMLDRHIIVPENQDRSKSAP